MTCPTAPGRPFNSVTDGCVRISVVVTVGLMVPFISARQRVSG